MRISQRQGPPGTSAPKGQGLRLQAHSTPDAQDVKARAAGHWLGILAAIVPELQPAIARLGHHVGCPSHGGRDGFRLFRDADETGGGICNTCGPCADGLATIQLFTGWTFPEALRTVAEYLGMGSEPHTPATRVVTPTIARREDDAAGIERRRAAITRTWGESLLATHPEADPLRLHLERRGLVALEVPPVLRFHPGLAYWHTPAGADKPVMLGTFPAMLAQVVNVAGEVVTIHRTYLTPDGRKLSEIDGVKLEARKKMPAIVPGGSRGAAVRLSPVAGRLGVAEGIETALAAHLLSGGTIPVWSAVDAGGLEALELPLQVSEVVIFADRDENGRGQDAAVKLARRLLAEGRSVKRVLPPLDFGSKADWNDLLIQGVAHAG